MLTTDTGGRLGGTQSRMLIVELWLVWWENSIYIWWEHVFIFRKVWMHRLHLCTSASWYIFLAKKAGANGECQQQVLQTKTCRRAVQDFLAESFTLRHIGIGWTQCGACPSSGMRWYSMRLPYLEQACLSAVYIIWHFLYLPSFLALQFVSLLLDLCRCRSPGRRLCRSQNPASGWSEQSDPAVIFQSPPGAKNAFKAGFQGSKTWILQFSTLPTSSLLIFSG